MDAQYLSYHMHVHLYRNRQQSKCIRPAFFISGSIVSNRFCVDFANMGTMSLSDAAAADAEAAGPEFANAEAAAAESFDGDTVSPDSAGTEVSPPVSADAEAAASSSGTAGGMVVSSSLAMLSVVSLPFTRFR